MKNRKLNRLIVFCMTVVLIITFWRFIEVVIYGYASENVVDTIMMLVFMPFIYMTIVFVDKHIQNYELKKWKRKENGLDKSGSLIKVRRGEFLFWIEKDASYKKRIFKKMMEKQGIMLNIKNQNHVRRK